jgi:sporulation protein YlmC with PRC-barrel domain
MEGEENQLDTNETSREPTPEAQPVEENVEPTVALRDFSEWHGKDLIDSDGERIGKLEDVYFDVETDQPQFATVKEGLFGRHLTFVPLTEMVLGPDDLQVSVSKSLVKNAPNIELQGDALSQEGESALYHYYQLNYTASDTPSGRRLARR